MEREGGTFYPHLDPKHLISSILPNTVLKLLHVSKNKNLLPESEIDPEVEAGKRSPWYDLFLKH